MRKVSKIIALVLAVVTLVSTLAIGVSAYSYPMSCSIYYKDESGKTVAPTKSFSFNAASGGDAFYASPSVDGYVLKNDSDGVVSYSMMDKSFPASNYVRNGTATYTVVYVKAYYVTIDYKYEDGSQAAPQYQQLYKKGTGFTVYSPSITGYTPNYSVFTGTLDASNYYRWATYYRNVYTVSYNANGGINAPTSQSKYYGDTLTLSASKPTRTGYNFQGWSSSSTATTASYQSGDQFSGNYHVTLYAVWKAKTYTVRYNANGGSGAPGSQTKTYGTAMTLSSTVPTRTGYNFTGWATYSYATSASYSAGGTWTRNVNITLYAVWEKEQYNVSYNANGGENAPSAQKKEYGTTLILSSQKPTRTGYTFMGWTIAPGSSRVAYNPGSSYLSNTGIVLYAVWTPETYTVSFDANGGSGAPGSVQKTYDTAVTLPTSKPTRDKYKFLGWSSNPNATYAEYSAGDTYDAEGSTTLYAVWEFINYDFSVSGLNVSDNNPYQYDTVAVSFRLDSWDQKNAYTGIPVTVYIDDNLIYSTTVDFSVYGIQYVNFNVNIGTLLGGHTMEARVNWSNHMSETRTGNNTDSISFDVQKLIDTSTGIVSPNATFYAGNTVVSAFTVVNNGASPITPDDGVDFTFRVSTYDASGKEVTVQTQTWDDVVIPDNSQNLVYFKWTIPSDAVGKVYNCTGTMNPTGLGNEGYLDDNTASYSKLIHNTTESQTPDTRYEKTAPAGYQSNPVKPGSTSGIARWNMWEYQNGRFILQSYGVQVTPNNPSVVPSSACKSASYASGKWTMKSGYGFTLMWNPVITSISGNQMPDTSAYTFAQSVYATFPEYAYNTTEGQYRTLLYEDGAYRFEQNTNADGDARLHYIPVYVGNGNYTVSATATQIWTPAGMITATRNSNTVVLNGSIYDDYYVGN